MAPPNAPVMGGGGVAGRGSSQWAIRTKPSEDSSSSIDVDVHPTRKKTTQRVTSLNLRIWRERRKRTARDNTCDPMVLKKKPKMLMNQEIRENTVDAATAAQLATQTEEVETQEFDEKCNDEELVEL